MAKDDNQHTVETDPCTGFPTTHKTKLSIPTIIWNKYGKSGNSSECEAIGSTTPSSQISPLYQEVQKNKFLRYVGLVLTLLSAITFSFNVLIIKLLTHCHPFSLGVWTFLLMTLFSVISLTYEVKVKKNESIFEKFSSAGESLENNGKNGMFYLYVSVRAFFGTSALILFFYAVKFLDAGDALVIDSASPIFVYVMAYLILREEMGIVLVITAVLAMTGVVFIARPPLFTGSETEYDLNTLIGVALSFLAMMCIVTNVIVLKFLENVHVSVVNTVFGLWGTVQCLILALLTGVFSVPKEMSDILLILGSALLFFTGQVFITLALQYEDAGPVGLLRTTEVLFIFLWQYLFLGVIPDAYSYIGASLILFGVILTVIRKWVGTSPSNSKIRNSPCKYLLY